MSKLIDRIAIGATALLTLLCVPYFLRFEKTHSDWSDENAATIANMSRNQREDLIANKKRLKKQLTPEKRETIVAMHEAVSDPDKARRFDAFHDWLQSLDVVERDSIRSAGSVEDKATQVQLLIAAEEQQSQGFTIDANDGWMRRFRGGEFAEKLKQDLEAAGIETVRISDREYDSIVGAITKYLPQEMNDDFNKALKNLREGAPDEERYRFRSNALGTAMWNWVRKRRKAPEPDAEQVDHVLNQIEDSGDREALKQLDLDQKQVLVGMMLVRSTNQFRFIVPYFPTDEEVADFWPKLTRPEQIELMALSPNQTRKRLNLMYLAAAESVPEDIRDMAKSMQERMERMQRESGNRRGGPGRRRGNRGDRNGRTGQRSGRSGEGGPPPEPPPGNRPIGPPPGPPPCDCCFDNCL